MSTALKLINFEQSFKIGVNLYFYDFYYAGLKYAIKSYCFLLFLLKVRFNFNMLLVTTVRHCETYEKIKHLKLKDFSTN